MVLSCGNNPQTPVVYSLQTGSLLYSFEGHDTETCNCSWTRKGDKFITGDINGGLITWKTPQHQVNPTWINSESANETQLT